jgi:hypothetical protein
MAELRTISQGDSEAVVSGWCSIVVPRLAKCSASAVALSRRLCDASVDQAGAAWEERLGEAKAARLKVLSASSAMPLLRFA